MHVCCFFWLYIPVLYFLICIFGVVLKSLWISTDFCFCTFSIIEKYVEDNWTSLCTCVFQFVFYTLSCIEFFLCIFHVVLKALNYMRQILPISVWKIFVQTLKKKHFCLIWWTSTYSLHCDLRVFVLKLSECNQVELYYTILAFFAAV